MPMMTSTETADRFDRMAADWTTDQMAAALRTMAEAMGVNIFAMPPDDTAENITYRRAILNAAAGMLETAGQVADAANELKAALEQHNGQFLLMNSTAAEVIAKAMAADPQLHITGNEPAPAPAPTPPECNCGDCVNATECYCYECWPRGTEMPQYIQQAQA